MLKDDRRYLLAPSPPPMGRLAVHTQLIAREDSLQELEGKWDPVATEPCENSPLRSKGKADFEPWKPGVGNGVQGANGGRTPFGKYP
ncbi:hypothetical protein VNO77_26891 [Canavalia gladiata]|uniref:Uncharacterized protein n=1 Tax=Canavalia gladiata TaxID=3824 RepID=A0AAN9Q6N9_CANGL